MRDKVSIERVKQLHPAIRQHVTDAIDEIELKWPAFIAVRIAQGLRTFEYQNDLYALGRTTVNKDGFDRVKLPMGRIVTKAKAGTSFHNYGLAIDFSILYDKDKNGVFDEVSWDMVKDGDFDHVPDWQEVVNVFLKHGFSWGGQWRTFKDYPHVEMAFGYTYRQLLDKYTKADFIPGTKYVKL